MSNSYFFEGNIRVKPQDCDALGHLNNSKYIDYFLNVREEAILDDLGYNMYQEASKTGLVWVVKTHQIEYIKPVHVMEKVLCQSLVISMRNRSCRVEFRMLDENKSDLKCVMWTDFVFWNMKTRQTSLIPSEMRNLFSVNLFTDQMNEVLRAKVKFLKKEM